MIDSSGLIDAELLEKLQERFCRANHMYLVCLGRNHGVITKCYGTEEQVRFIHELAGMDKHMRLLDRLLDNEVEHVVEEEMEQPHVKMCGVSIPVDGKTELIWVVFAWDRDKAPEDAVLPADFMTTTEAEFYRSIELLEVISKQLLQVKMSQLMAEESSRKSIEAEQEIKEQLRESETMTSILCTLESEESFAEIAGEILRYAGEFLEISGAFVLQEDIKKTSYEVVSEFVLDDTKRYEMKLHNRHVGTVAFFNGKPYMISSDTSLPENFQAFFREMSWKAGVFLPMEIKQDWVMYLGFYQEEERIWTVEEIKFINDVKRVMQGILLKRIANNSLASSYASLEAILENVGSGVIVWDEENHKSLYKNQYFEEFFGALMDEIGEEEVIKRGKKALNGKNFDEVFIPELERWIDMNKSEIEWVDGRKVLLATIYDITDKKKYQKKIEKQTNKDFLTGLYNRMRCEQDLLAMIEQAEKTGGQGAVLYMDLDDFKHINDGLGIQYGDVLLKAISKSLKDIQEIQECCYRMGGDEFVILISEDRIKRMNRILEEIKAVFMRPWFLKGSDYYCTMSMGIAKFPTDGTNVEELMQKADSALFEAKHKGKNRVCFFEPEREGQAYRKLDMEKNMRNATNNDCREFEVYYQPVIDIEKEGKPCVGAEALVRWNSKEMGFLSPTDFIPLAEYLGLINPIGEYVLLQAAKRCKYWNDMGHPEFKVNVNLSVIQLLQNGIVDQIRKVLEESRIYPYNLVLEVTESLAINDMDRMKEILGEIKALGVRVALDDFGTGYSSLNHIREMPIDIIKIDRCFVENLGKDSFSDAFVRMVSELAASMDMKVCVEGVEGVEQLEAIMDKKIHMVQGFYFGKPMPLEQFEAEYLN